MTTLIGPFQQIVTMRHLPLHGALADEQLEVIPDGGIVVNDGRISDIGNYQQMRQQYNEANLQVISDPSVAFPGMIDAHTHLCWAGTRAGDFAARNAGKTYQEIAAAGGGIWSTVTHTRKATNEELLALMQTRMHQLMLQGITTVEIKTGYGLSVSEELRMMDAIAELNHNTPQTVVPTCLAAHMLPRDYSGSHTAYLQEIIDELMPALQHKGFCRRFDIFIEDHAFTALQAKPFVTALRKAGFDIAVHGDQFTTGGSALAVEMQARSVDHLEASGDEEIALLAGSSTVAMALPGASLGLGCAFAPARRLLDAGACVAIASDWNPGSAPMGNLMVQAAVLATYEKLTHAEVWAGITYRAAHALALPLKGKLTLDYDADIISFSVPHYQEVLYAQGMLRPKQVWAKGLPQLPEKGIEDGQ